MAARRVQTASNSGVSVGSVAVTLVSTSAGTTCVAIIGTLTQAVSSISGGGTWTKMENIPQGAVNCEMWYSGDVPEGTTSITVNVTIADAIGVIVTEWKGFSSASVHSNNSGINSAPVTGSTTTPPGRAVFISGHCFIPTTVNVNSVGPYWNALATVTDATSLKLQCDCRLVNNSASDTLTVSTNPTAWASVIGCFLVTSDETTISKFYIHRSTSTVLGTLPAAGTSISAFTPTIIAGGSDTNRTMDSVISSVAQTSNVLTTGANQNPQSGLILRHVSVPIAAQTLFSQDFSFNISYSESNTLSNFLHLGYVIGVWRPSTGTSVGLLVDLATTGLGIIGATTETNKNAAPGIGLTMVDANDGDIIVVELWRGLDTQSMSTAYTNTYFYDGTIESSITDEAAFINFSYNPIAMLPIPPIPHRNPMIQLLPQ